MGLRKSVLAKENKALVLRLVDALNRDREAIVSKASEFLADDIVLHDAHGQDIRGIHDYVERHLRHLFEVYPDASIAVEDIIAEGDKVVARMNITGTQAREIHHPLLDVPVTGRKVKMDVVYIERIAGDKIVEEWERQDTMGVLKQLGFAIMPTENYEAKEIKALMHHWINESNKGNAAAISVTDEICAPNIVVHSIAESTGLDDYKRFMSEVRNAFPDIQLELHDMIVEGNEVAIRFTETGTHKGAFMGIPPTGKGVTIRGVEVDRIVGGKVVEIWSGLDALGLMQQLGFVLTSSKVEGSRKGGENR